MISIITGFDSYVQSIVDVGRSPIIISLFNFITQCGDARWIAVVAIGMAVVAWRHRRFEYKAGLAVALLGSLAASSLIKILVHRVRPDSPFALMDVSGYSFPSMHAAVSLATYGFLAYMIYKLMHPPHHRLPWVYALSGLILLIGFSRIYLGVHYTSDVLGGFVVGGIFLWLGIQITSRLGTRH